MIWIYTTETLLYLCFALLIGALLIHLVPVGRRPHVKISRRLLQVSILGIVVLSAAPVIRLILFLYEDVGLWLTIQNIVGEFEVGRAWSLTVLTSLFFYLFVSIAPIFKRRLFIWISLVFTLILILALGWGSHSASLTNWSGFAVHSLHFTAVTVWAGLLLIVSWFSTNQQNWQAFLSWFTPVALSCLAIVMGSGFYIMTLALDLPEYQNAWMIPYGQAILWKHLLLIPVLIFAVINGVWIRRKLQRKDEINPVPWAKAESLVLILVFAATGILGQQEPPHSIEAFIRGNGPSPLFAYFYDGPIVPTLDLSFNFNFLSTSFFAVAAFFAFLVIYGFKQKVVAYVSFIMSILCVLALYLAFMSGI